MNIGDKVRVVKTDPDCRFMEGIKVFQEGVVTAVHPTDDWYVWADFESVALRPSKTLGYPFYEDELEKIDE